MSVWLLYVIVVGEVLFLCLPGITVFSILMHSFGSCFASVSCFVSDCFFLVLCVLRVCFGIVCVFGYLLVLGFVCVFCVGRAVFGVVFCIWV